MTATASPMRTFLKVVAGVVAVALVLVASYRLLSFLSRDSYNARATYTGVRALFVDNGHGNVNVVTAPPGSPVRVLEHVTRSFSTPKRTVTRQPGGVLRLKATCKSDFGDDCHVSYTISAPPEVSLLLTAAKGDVVARDYVSRTPLTLRSAAGSVVVDGLTAPRISLSSSAGDVRARGLSSPSITADSAAGDVRLEIVGTPGSISAETSAGDVQLTLPNDVYAVDAEAVAGKQPHVSVRTDPKSPLKVKARSTAGTVTIQPAA